jgi:predicted nucleic acid-binding protein
VTEDSGVGSGPRYLADTSALTRMEFPAVSSVLSPAIAAGEVATCSIVDMEMLFSARTHAAVAAVRVERSNAFPFIVTVQADFDRAIEVMVMLAAANRHRSVRIPDLILAAVAERAGLTILHYDADFDHVAEVTGQPTRWVAPRGSL